MKDLVSREEAIIQLSHNKQRGDEEWELAVESDMEIIKTLPPAQPEIIHCEDCKWGREACGNIECFADSNIPPEYHGYDWFCPNGERRQDEQ